MIKAIIVDDEARGRQGLANLIKEYCPDVEVLALCESAREALQKIPELKPELLFLDVEMPEMSGFDLLEQLPSHDFDVIFTTAHSEHAIKAIKFSALDYLLKPIDGDELKEAVDKNIQKRTEEQAHRMQLLLNNRKSASGVYDKIALPTSEGYLFLPVEEILRCEASGSYTLFYLDKKEPILVCKNLKEYEELLIESGFYRIHHSHLVNVKHIQKYLRGDGGQVVMKDGSVIEVSRRKKEAFLQYLMLKQE